MIKFHTCFGANLIKSPQKTLTTEEFDVEIRGTVDRHKILQNDSGLLANVRRVCDSSPTTLPSPTQPRTSVTNSHTKESRTFVVDRERTVALDGRPSRLMLSPTTSKDGRSEEDDRVSLRDKVLPTPDDPTRTPPSTTTS